MVWEGKGLLNKLNWVTSSTQASSRLASSHQTSADPQCNSLPAFLIILADPHHSIQHTNAAPLSRPFGSPRAFLYPLLVYYIFALYSLTSTLHTKTRPKSSSPCTNTTALTAPEVKILRQDIWETTYQVTYALFSHKGFQIHNGVILFSTSTFCTEETYRIKIGGYFTNMLHECYLKII